MDVLRQSIIDHILGLMIFPPNEVLAVGKRKMSGTKYLKNILSNPFCLSNMDKQIWIYSLT